MQKPKEVIEACRLIRNGLRGGMAMDEISVALSKAQPNWKSRWLQVSKDTAAGMRFSESVKKRGLWNDIDSAALLAGEISGAMPAVLNQTSAMAANSIRIRKTFTGKLAMPIIYIVGGLSALVGFVIKVAPSLTTSIAKKDRKGLIAFMDSAKDGLEQYWWVSLVILGVLIAYAIVASRTPAIKIAMWRLLDRVPLLGSGLRLLYSGVWARYMVLLDRAGDVPFEVATDLSTKSIPHVYRSAFERMKVDAMGPAGFIGAVDVSHMPAHDPRKKWPQMLQVALRTAASTNSVADSMDEVSTDMLEEGIRLVESFMGFLEKTGMFFGAIAIVTPMLSMFLIQGEQFANLQK